MMKQTKFGSLNLDTPSSRYEFLKFVFKSMKNKKIKTTTQTDRWGPRSTGPARQQNRTEDGD